MLTIKARTCRMLEWLHPIGVVVALALLVFGCDTLNASGHLRPLTLSVEHNGNPVPREPTNRVDIESDCLKRLNSGIYGDSFNAYWINECIIQPIEGLWSHDVVYTTVLIQNVGEFPLRIKLDDAQFVPLEVYKVKRNVGVTFRPFISVVFYDGSTPSSMTIPSEASEVRPFQPSNNRRPGWDLVENKMIAFKDMVHEVVRGEIHPIVLSPGDTTVFQLAFRVGFIKGGDLTLYLDKDKSATIHFVEMNYFKAKEWLDHEGEG